MVGFWQEKKSAFCNLQNYYKKEGFDKTNTLFERIKLLSEKSDNIGSATVSRIGIFNSFMDFYYKKDEELNEHIFYEFLKKYFITAEKKGYCLNTRKQLWNSFVNFGEYVFNLQENTILKVPEKKVNGFETKIKTKPNTVVNIERRIELILLVSVIFNWSNINSWTKLLNYY